MVINGRSTVNRWRYLQCSKTKEGEGPAQSLLATTIVFVWSSWKVKAFFFYQQRVKAKSRWNKFGDSGGARCCLAGQQGRLLHCSWSGQPGTEADRVGQSVILSYESEFWTGYKSPTAR